MLVGGEGKGTGREGKGREGRGWRGEGREEGKDRRGGEGGKGEREGRKEGGEKTLTPRSFLTDRRPCWWPYEWRSNNGNKL
jgi:hypothetical protein